ncbi:MAG: Fur family transcriptional regulator [Mycobacteriales bacterium]|jgi:Fur family ferric uptake transcriptional regulator
MTRQREAITAVLESSGGFRSAQELYADLRRSGRRVGLTTVYRTLATLAGSGAVDVLRGADGEAAYRWCATDRHHHHLVCRDCGRTVEVAGTAVERWAERVAAEHGYSDVSHTVEIFGRCAECDG